mgnify:FL=1|jgi:antitoxin component YwqK of YwqJK toxin-antitoxin module
MKNKQNNVSLFERQGLWYEANSLVPFTGMVDSYYENGQLEVFARYVVGVQDGYSEMYYQNGQLRLSSNFTAGEPDGLRESYFENGNL